MRVLGIDLGTTNSCAAVMDFGKPLMVPISNDHYSLPSVVAFDAQGRYLVGEIARRQAAENPEQTIFAAKRLMGRSFDDPHTQRAISTVPYRCVPGPSGDVRIAIGKNAYAIPQISALVLGEIKRIAESHFNEPITQAVITVPAYFNDRQRQATKDAGKIAGLEVLGVVNEPTAAALAHGVHRGRKRRVAVYDLGGGTFDASILEVGGGVVQVLACGGDAFLGGYDFDNRLFAWLWLQIESEWSTNLTNELGTRQRLREAAEAAKIALSSQDTAQIALPFLATRPDGECLHFDCEVVRSEFEEMVVDLVGRTETLFCRTVKDAGLQMSDLDEILLVGGMTRMPLVRDRMQKATGLAPTHGVHPDLVVAVGAAIHANMLVARSETQVLIDATPHNLGILTVAGIAETIIPRGTSVPAEVKRKFSTVRDGQDTVAIVVFQGDSRAIANNEVLGEFRLEGIRAAPRGEVEIEIKFGIAADGTVNVSAIDTETGRNQALVISSQSAIAPDEMASMQHLHQDLVGHRPSAP